MTTTADKAFLPISLAVAAVLLLTPEFLAGQELNAELYGNFRYSYNRADDGTDVRWASANNASRLGVRGDVTGKIISAFFHLETGVSVDSDTEGRGLTQRFFYGGLRGDFGAVTVGRNTAAYKAAGLGIDPFYDASAISAAGGVPTTGLFAGATFGLRISPMVLPTGPSPTLHPASSASPATASSTWIPTRFTITGSASGTSSMNSTQVSSTTCHAAMKTGLRLVPSTTPSASTARIGEVNDGRRRCPTSMSLPPRRAAATRTTSTWRVPSRSRPRSWRQFPQET